MITWLGTTPYVGLLWPGMASSGPICPITVSQGPPAVPGLFPLSRSHLSPLPACPTPASRQHCQSPSPHPMAASVGISCQRSRRLSPHRTGPPPTPVAALKLTPIYTEGLWGSRPPRANHSGKGRRGHVSRSPDSVRTRLHSDIILEEQIVR